MSTKKRRASDLLEKLDGPFTFGTFMLAARTRRDMTQTQMAKFLGISKGSLCDIEKGRQFVTPAFAYRVAKKCGLAHIHAVEASINDQLRRLGLDLTIKVIKAS